MPTKYSLTLSEHQADIVIRALDLYTRIGIGQFEEVEHVYSRTNLAADWKTAERIRAGLNIAKEAAGHHPNGSYSIHNDKVDDNFRAAYDIQQVIRHRLAWDRQPEGSPRYHVHFDAPQQISKEPLPTIEKV